MENINCVCCNDTVPKMPKHHSLPPTGAASFLVYATLKTIFTVTLSLKIVTKKIERMAGIGKPKMPTDSVQNNKLLHVIVIYFLYL